MGSGKEFVVSPRNLSPALTWPARCLTSILTPPTHTQPPGLCTSGISLPWLHSVLWLSCFKNGGYRGGPNLIVSLWGESVLWLVAEVRDTPNTRSIACALLAGREVKGPCGRNLTVDSRSLDETGRRFVFSEPVGENSALLSALRDWAEHLLGPVARLMYRNYGTMDLYCWSH